MWKKFKINISGYRADFCEMVMPSEAAGVTGGRSIVIPASTDFRLRSLVIGKVDYIFRGSRRSGGPFTLVCTLKFSLA